MVRRLRRNRATRLACAGIRTRQLLDTRPSPALSRAYAEILIQSAANCQDGLKLAFYISATLMDSLTDTLRHAGPGARELSSNAWHNVHQVLPSLPLSLCFPSFFLAYDHPYSETV